MAKFRVMCWNVENLFLPRSEDPASEAGPATAQAFEAKLTSLAAVIDGARPDVAALQEIGPNVIDRLQGALSHKMPHSALGQADDRGIRVAFLSTHKLHDVAQIRQFPPGVRAVQAKDEIFNDPLTPGDEAATDAMGRGALEARVKVAGPPCQPQLRRIEQSIR